MEDAAGRRAEVHQKEQHFDLHFLPAGQLFHTVYDSIEAKSGWAKTFPPYKARLTAKTYVQKDDVD